MESSELLESESEDEDDSSELSEEESESESELVALDSSLFSKAVFFEMEATGLDL